MNPINFQKIRWKCRRGMLELDIILERFFLNGFFKLSLQEQQAFNRFLDHSDPDLYDWLMGYGTPTDIDDQKIVLKLIRGC